MKRAFIQKSVTVLAFLLSLGPLGCLDENQLGVSAPPPICPSPGSVSGGTELFHDRLLEIAATYEEYGRLDPDLRFAPKLCADAGRTGGSRASISSSQDATTHGRKLYWLFVRNSYGFGSYVSKSGPNPVGQVIVKEAWTAEDEEDRAKADTHVIRTGKVRRQEQLVENMDVFIPYVRQGDHVYRAGRKAALFIMYKTDPRNPDTDEGWVYGTVTPDGKQVTSAGKVESCMSCHRNAPHDRLFGLPKE
jgi:hypothetical protein